MYAQALTAPVSTVSSTPLVARCVHAGTDTTCLAQLRAGRTVVISIHNGHVTVRLIDRRTAPLPFAHIATLLAKDGTR